MKKLSNPKPTANDKCIISCMPYAHLHEIYYGNPNARLSQDHGLQVRLSRTYHQDNKTGIHGGNSELDAVLKVKACMQWMAREGKTEKDFYDIFGVYPIGKWEMKARLSDWWDRTNFRILPSKLDKGG